MSSNGWRRVPLRELLTIDLDKVPVRAGIQYPMVGVYSFGKGLFHREPVDGTTCSYKTFNRLKSEHFVMSQLFGWEGALALSSEDFSGHFVSPQFPTFLCEPELNREYLGYFTRQPVFWHDLGSRTRGMGDRRRTLNPEALFACEIPLPDRKEQDRIVAKLDALSARIDEGRECSRQIEQESTALCRSVIHSAEASEKVELSRLLRLRPPDVEVEPHLTYEFAGVYSFGRGVFKGPVKTGMEFSYPRLTRLREGDFVYPKLMAWEGALGVVPPDCDGLVVSTEFPVFEINSESVLPEVIDIYFRSPDIWPLLSGTSTGTNVRRRRLKPADFLKFRMPLPSRTDQFQLREIVQRTKVMHENVSTMIAQLDAMLPSILDKAFKGEL